MSLFDLTPENAYFEKVLRQVLAVPASQQSKTKWQWIKESLTTIRL